MLIIVLLMISCGNGKQSYLKYNTFFEQEKIIECYIDNLPQPKLDNSVLYNSDGKVLYFKFNRRRVFNLS